MTRHEVEELMNKNTQFGTKTIFTAKSLKTCLGIDNDQLKQLVQDGIIINRSEFGKRFSISNI